MHFGRNAIWDEPGFKITTSEDTLRIEALNPEREIKYKVSRWERFRIGVWLIRRSIMNP